MLNNSLKLVICVGLLALSLFPRQVEALSVSQVRFNDEILINDKKLLLMGAGLQRFHIHKMVVVGFYLAEKVSKEHVLDNFPKRIEVGFVQNVMEDELRSELTNAMNANTGNLDTEVFGERLNQFLDILSDVGEGDRFGFTYFPDEGTKVDLNGRLLATIEGDDFARVLFSVYIGDKPMDQRTKVKLLGRIND